MSTSIKKIKLFNYKRFRNYTIEPNNRINILVGDNEVGKSSILEAIDLVSSGNIRRVESIGLDRLLNAASVQAFLHGTRTFDNLPILKIELYLSGQFDHTMNGRNNTDKHDCDGIRLVCEPNPDYRTEIASILSDYPDYFPYDYYSIRFSTFADIGYTGYKKKIHTTFIDSTNMNSEYATNDFIHRMYIHCTETDIKERVKHKSSYRLLRRKFQDEDLKDLNNRIASETKYAFGLRGGNSVDLENDLMLYEDSIGIDSRGTGRQVFVKTDFALKRSGDNVDIILLEEPENHLSPVNLRLLIQNVAETQNGQMFITTHNSLISTRLELQNLLIMQEQANDKPLMLNNLKDETAKYFMKAPPANIIEFSLANKVILVEGPSEYMLFSMFYKHITTHHPEEDKIHIINIRGLSFLRYLEIAKLTRKKVAVVTDNDGDVNKHCIEKYKEYKDDPNIKVFFDPDNTKNTFEVVLYNDNIDICNTQFGSNAQYYMLNNKTEAAFILLSQDHHIVIPDYIKRAIEWIKE